MNKDIEELKKKLNKKLENYGIDKKCGQLSVDSVYYMFPNEMETLLNYINELETNRDKAIEYINNNWDGCSYTDATLKNKVAELNITELLEILRGKDEDR